MRLAHYLHAVDQANTIKRYGKVLRIVGLMIESQGPNANIGEVCLIHSSNKAPVISEVVGFNNEKIILMPYAQVTEIGPGCLVESTGQALSVKIGRGLIGKVVDSLGENLDGSRLPKGLSTCLTEQSPPNPLLRPPISEPIQVGVKTIDSLLTVGEGQRVGIFAGSGVGKSTLLGMIARNSSADRNVFSGDERGKSDFGKEDS